MLRDLEKPSNLPRGFRPSTSGSLIVPEDVSRLREVWTKDEGRLIDRTIALLQSRNVQMMLRCGNPNCSGEKLERIKEPGSDYVLQCGCKKRVFTRAI